MSVGFHLRHTKLKTTFRFSCQREKSKIIRRWDSDADLPSTVMSESENVPDFRQPGCRSVAGWNGRGLAFHKDHTYAVASFPYKGDTIMPPAGKSSRKRKSIWKGAERTGSADRQPNIDADLRHILLS
jgi:hypothetical protein